jgi:hypothetical protein
VGSPDDDALAAPVELAAALTSSGCAFDCLSAPGAESESFAAGSPALVRLLACAPLSFAVEEKTRSNDSSLHCGLLREALRFDARSAAPAATEYPIEGIISQRKNACQGP